MNTIIRIIFRRGPRRYNFLPATADVRPQSSFSVPSRADPRRRIAVNVFYPPEVSPEDRRKLPVHLNAHGSGFCYKVFTEDSELCAYLAQKAGCIVLDTDYAKAPKHPFPAAFNDVSDVVAYVLGHPEDWDLRRFTMGGCSSGACLSLSVAAVQAKGVVKSLQVWYPPVDLSTHESNLTPVPELAKGSPGMPFSLWERYRFEEAYVPDDVDREDPRLSPIYAPVESFPPVTIICGDRDPMLPSIQRFVTKLKEGGNDLVEMIAPGCGHGFERLVEPDSDFAVLRDKALELCVRRMQESWA
ncbi:alpha/beta-hydrolase [Auricularia subglabra TFB-10046 SS5]|nr:alpha/beta-hydrolase [Auricularia subglabra TFB-10046 SS5]